MKRYLLLFLVCLLLQLSPVSASDNAVTYSIPTMRRSHWALDPLTGTPLVQNGKPYRDTGTGIYNFTRTLDPAKTAIVCMDCWKNMADPQLEAHFHSVTETVIFPLMLKAAQRGFTNIIITNDPATNTHAYGVDPALEPIINNYGGFVLYNEIYDNPANPLAFYYWLSDHKIDTLIYTGFSSTVCLAARLNAMFFMRRYFTRVYFIPEGSAAVENLDNWDGHIHENMTEVISKQFEIIHAADFLGIP